MKSFILASVLIGGLVMSASQKELVIFDFNDPASYKPWQTINDTVMGGVSESSLKAGGAQTALFAGTVSLKNYGGFCTASSRADTAHDLSSYAGIAARVRGDGKQYKLTLKTDTAFTGFVYQFDFSTTKGQWITVQAPFKAFAARYRGRPQPGAPPVDRAKITSFGFLIADKQEGPFTLEIDWIKAY